MSLTEIREHKEAYALAQKDLRRARKDVAELEKTLRIAHDAHADENRIVLLSNALDLATVDVAKAKAELSRTGDLVLKSYQGENE